MMCHFEECHFNPGNKKADAVTENSYSRVGVGALGCETGSDFRKLNSGIFPIESGCAGEGD